MEREVLLTGIGGQGVQLAARTLAFAAVADGREVMVFGTYGGSMRGGNTDATVIVGDEPLLTPPTVDETWSALAMHHAYWPDVRKLLRSGSVVVIDSSVFRGELGLDVACEVVEVPASTIATDLGSPQAGSMVALGAYAAATGLVTLDALVAATAEVLPPYRAQHATANAVAIRAGWDLVPGPVAEAWPTSRTASVGSVQS
jgi:Pyruvate/2-oxoacid:ferredoxin oxidoreductase gamma subunit